MSTKLNFDPDVVLGKLSTIRRCLEIASGLDELPALEQAPEWMRLDLTVLQLTRAIQALADLGSHLLAANGWELPREAGAIFETLASQGVLEAPQAKLGRAMIGFRNIATHQYRALDPEIVESIRRERLPELAAIADRLRVVTVGAAP